MPASPPSDISARRPFANLHRCSRLGLFLLVAAWVLFATAAVAEVRTVEATRDNTLFEDAQGDTSNGSGPSLFAGRISLGRVRRALVSFHVQSVVPPGVQVDSVTLQLHLSSSSDPLPRAIRVYRVLTAWGEGTSVSSGGSGAPAEYGDATWLHTFFPETFWASPGGDFAPAPSAVQTVAGEGDWVWRDPQLTADVQAWLATGADHGWAVLGDETVAGTARRFDSREYATPGRRPRLTIHFTTVTPAASRSWGDLKIRFR